MELTFSGEVWWWKGPAPWHYVTVPGDQSAAIADASSIVSYGWGCIPVTARIGDTQWETSLFPKDGGYVVPLKTVVRRAEDVGLGDEVTLTLVLDLGRGRGG